MGILISGILGPFRKKTGPLIGRRCKGKNVITALHHTSNKPLTEAQLDVQLRFGLLSNFLNKIDQLVNPGFKAYAKGKSPVNAAFTYNYAHAFVTAGDTYLINYPKIVYSRGYRARPEAAQVIAAAGHLQFSWNLPGQSAYCQYTDLASFLVCNPAKQGFIQVPLAAERYATAYQLEIPADYTGDTLHCYMNFSSANGKQAGNSLYIGPVVYI
jgi:hypothetical protein